MRISAGAIAGSDDSATDRGGATTIEGRGASTLASSDLSADLENSSTKCASSGPRAGAEGVL